MRNPRGGFTLFEVLAVVVLVSLAAGALTVNLAGMSEATSFRSAAARLRDLDARARLHARLRGPVVLRREGGMSTLALIELHSGERVIEVELGPGFALAMKAEPSADAILFTGDGQSLDYDVTLSRGDREARWTVFGATGWISEQGSEE